jgi:hypothetical protein
MVRVSISEMLPYSLAAFPLLTASLFIKEPSRDAGYLEICGRAFLAEPLFIVTAILATIETIARALLALFALSILCLIPDSPYKQEFKENIVDVLESSAFWNLSWAAYSTVSIVTNLSLKELDSKPFENFSASLARYCEVKVIS